MFHFFKIVHGKHINKFEQIKSIAHMTNDEMKQADISVTILKIFSHYELSHVKLSLENGIISGTCNAAMFINDDDGYMLSTTKQLCKFKKKVNFKF